MRSCFSQVRFEIIRGVHKGVLNMTSRSHVHESDASKATTIQSGIVGRSSIEDVKVQGLGFLRSSSVGTQVGS